MTQETGYKVTRNGDTYSAHHGSELIAMGCLEVEDALQAIWQHAGRNPNETYYMVNDVVMRAVKE